jgi:hypothetical protein
MNFCRTFFNILPCLVICTTFLLPNQIQFPINKKNKQIRLFDLMELTVPSNFEILNEDQINLLCQRERQKPTIGFKSSSQDVKLLINYGSGHASETDLIKISGILKREMIKNNMNLIEEKILSKNGKKIILWKLKLLNNLRTKYIISNIFICSLNNKLLMCSIIYNEHDKKEWDLLSAEIIKSIRFTY